MDDGAHELLQACNEADRAELWVGVGGGADHGDGIGALAALAVGAPAVSQAVRG